MKISPSTKAMLVLESLQAQGAEYAPALEPRDVTGPGVLNDLSRSLTDELSSRWRRSGVELREEHSRLSTYFQSVQEGLPTKHEDPVAYGKFALLVPEVADAAAELGCDLPETLSLGTVASGSINAHIVTIDAAKDDYLLVFNRQILAFTDLFSRFIGKSIAQEVSSYSSKQHLRNREPSESEVRLLGGVVYYLSNRVQFFRDEWGGIDHIICFDLDRPVPVPELTCEVSKNFKEMLNVAMMFFVIAHELAHLNILHDKSRSHKDSRDGENTFLEELDCDHLGCRIAAQAATRTFKTLYPHGWQKFGTVGSLFFLSCFSLLEKCSFIMMRGPGLPRALCEIDPTNLEANAVGSYPTALFRRYVVRAVLEEEFRRAGVPDVKGWIFEAHDWIAALFDECWIHFEKEFSQRFQAREQLRREIAERRLNRVR